MPSAAGHCNEGMEPQDTASGVKPPMSDGSMEVNKMANKKNDIHSVVSMSKCALTCVFLINNLLVLLFVVMLHYVLPTTDSVTQEPESTTSGIQMSHLSAKALANGTEVPLGTIVAWIPSPNPAWIPPVELPVGWQICNGSIITDNRSPWVGQDTPNLTDRFLRGGNTSHFLIYEEDQMQDHQHVDRGHTHIDQGHSHNDSGHTHTDFGHTHTDYGHTHIDQGHSHTDTGHGHTDAGHSHGFTDNIVYTGAGGGWGEESDGYDHRDESKSTSSAVASIQTGYAVITDGNANIAMSFANISREQAIILPSSAVISTSQAILSNGTSNIQGVDPGVDGARVGSETRPKSTYIVWIMKVFEPV